MGRSCEGNTLAMELGVNDHRHRGFLPRSVLEIAACATLPFLLKMRLKGKLDCPLQRRTEFSRSWFGTDQPNSTGRGLGYF